MVIQKMRGSRPSLDSDKERIDPSFLDLVAGPAALPFWWSFRRHPA
jgi:hypothetical protein